MKIAMLGHKRIPSREGGVEVVVEELAVRMVQKGHDVTVYNRKGYHVSNKSLTDSGKGKRDYRGVHIVPVFTFERRSLNAVVYAFLATLKASRRHFDVIHFHAEGSCAMLPIAKKLTHAKCLVTVHGLDWKRSKWGGFATNFILFGEKMAVKYADQIIVLSKNVQNYFWDTYQRKTILIPNGISKPQRYRVDTVREKYHLEKDSYILFLARLVPEKGLHYLIDAYRDLQTEKKLVIAGGSSHSTEYVMEIKKKAEKDERIIMTGFVQEQELGELYSNAYLYILPSDVEGMPISLLEAMSYGNCCVVSDIPENKDVIEEHGRSFIQGNAEDLKAVLQELLNDPELVAYYKNTASDYICEKYQWDAVTEKTLTLYGEKDENIDGK